MSLPNPYVLLAIIFGTIAALGGIYFAGYRHGIDVGNSKIETAVAQAEQKAAAAQKAQDDISTAEAVKQAEAQQLVEHTFDTIEQKVPIYVTKTDRICYLSNGFVRLWNDAVAGVDRLPDSPRQSDASASAVSAADALNNAVTNSAIYHRTATQLTGLQDWIRQQEQVK